MASSLTRKSGPPVRPRSPRTSRPRGRPVTSRSPGDLQGGGAGPRGQVRVQPGCRRDHLGADAVDLHGLDHRPGGGLAHRAAGDQHRQLADEVDPLLGQQRRARRLAARASQSAAAAGSATTSTPLPSYPPVGVLSTTGQPTRSPNAASVGRRRAPAPRPGRGCRRRSAAPRIAALSWAKTSAAGRAGAPHPRRPTRPAPAAARARGRRSPRRSRLGERLAARPGRRQRPPARRARPGRRWRPAPRPAPAAARPAPRRGAPSSGPAGRRRRRPRAETSRRVSLPTPG